MPVLSREVAPVDGRPLVRIYVAMGRAEATRRARVGLAVAAPIEVEALVDTGAGRSQVDIGVVMGLGVFAVGEVEVVTASTGDEPAVMELFVVDLAFTDPEGGVATDVEVVGSDKLHALRVGMLLGRDILDRCLLAYDGPNRRFSLAYDNPASPGTPGDGG